MKVIEVFYSYYEETFNKLDSSIVIHESEEKAKMLIKEVYGYMSGFKITKCIEFDLIKPRILE